MADISRKTGKQRPEFERFPVTWFKPYSPCLRQEANFLWQIPPLKTRQKSWFLFRLETELRLAPGKRGAAETEGQKIFEVSQNEIANANNSHLVYADIRSVPCEGHCQHCDSRLPGKS